MSSVVWANNAGTTLAAAITSEQTTITVTSGSGALFPSPAAGQFFPVTLISQSNANTFEITYCTARSGDTLTVTRAQEGTAAQAFAAGDFARNLITAGTLTTTNQTAGPVGSVRNLRVNPSSSTTAVAIADEIIVTQSLGGPAYRLGAYDQTLNIATTGAGGMDISTSLVSTVIAAYAIFNPTTGQQAILGVNAGGVVAPSIYGNGHMPAGFTASALIGAWQTNSSGQFINFTQINRDIEIPLTTILSTGVGTTIVQITSQMPFNAVRLRGLLGAQTSVITSGSLSVYATSGELGQNELILGQAANETVSAIFDVGVTIPGSTFYSVVFAAGTLTAVIDITGYTF
jgi:hypothetical protein